MGRRTVGQKQYEEQSSARLPEALPVGGTPYPQESADYLRALVAHQTELGIGDRGVTLLLHILTLQERGTEPTYEALCAAWGKSNTQVRQTVTELRDLGMVEPALVCGRTVVSVREDLIQKLREFPDRPAPTGPLPPTRQYGPAASVNATSQPNGDPGPVGEDAGANGPATVQPAIPAQTPLASGIGIDRLLYKAEEVAPMLAISPAQVYKLAKQGVLPSIRLNRSVRFPAKALKQWAGTQG